jgi:RES domain
VRPLIGSYVSVAQFRTTRQLRLVDCSRKEIGDLAAFLEPNLSAEDIDKIVWSDMNRAFSKPVERGDESLDYIPTQILAETFKFLGFDGVAYKSSYGETGFNVALFNLASADLINCGLYRIKDVSITKQEEDSRYFVKEPPATL